MVRAVDLGVAVQAALAEQLLRAGGRGGAGQAGAAVCGARVLGREMALLAEPRHARLQQVRVHGAVRAVAERALFADGRVLPEERAALLGVARVAGLVHGGLREQARPVRPVRVVAVAAGERLAVVGGARPVEPRAVRVALETDRVLLLGQTVGVAGEGDDRRTVARIGEMARAGAVAGLAGPALEGGARVLQEDVGVERVGPVLGLDGVAAPTDLEPDEALALLSRWARWLDGGLLIGVDLVKDPDLLHAAYNDAQGVTARFNRNLLARANAELGANFELGRWAHGAFYHPALQRIEMHLISRCDQTVQLCGLSQPVAEGESLHTENSYKHTIPGFQTLLARAGLRTVGHWTDAQGWFGFFAAVPDGASG